MAKLPEINPEIEDIVDGNKNRALCLLAAGYSRKQVAKQVGITEATLRGWARHPEFKKQLRNAVAEIYNSAIAELCSGSREAAQELRRIINDPDVSARVKISAISTLFSNAEKAKAGLLEDRLEALENSLNGNNQAVTDDTDQS